MTPEVEKKRREVFEAWMSQKIGSRYLPGLDNRRDADGEYVYEPAASYWAGFNASLDAVEIHTPGKFELSDSPGSMAWNHCIDEYTRNITATGLGLRIKE